MAAAPSPLSSTPCSPHQQKKPLLSLSLNHLDPTAYSAVLSALPILTNTLTTLTFLGTFPPTTPASVTSLSTLASLNHLVLQTYNVAHLRDVDALLRALTPCQPLAFSLRCNDSTHGRELLPALVPMVQTRACERLKSLTVHLEYLRSEEELWEWPDGAVFRTLQDEGDLRNLQASQRLEHFGCRFYLKVLHPFSDVLCRLLEKKPRLLLTRAERLEDGATQCSAPPAEGGEKQQYQGVKGSNYTKKKISCGLTLKAASSLVGAAPDVQSDLVSRKALSWVVSKYLVVEQQ